MRYWSATTSNWHRGMATRKRKRGNRQFIDPTGDVWDSQFEWHVYTGLRDQGYTVRRCDQRDSIAYHTPVKEGSCLECDGTEVVQRRVYTPDLWVVEPEQADDASTRRGYFVECKGYFPQQRRAMLRCVAEQHPGIDLRFLFSKEVRLTKARTNVAYVCSMIKCPAAAWNNGSFEWRYPK